MIITYGEINVVALMKHIDTPTSFLYFIKILIILRMNNEFIWIIL